MGIAVHPRELRLSEFDDVMTQFFGGDYQFVGTANPIHSVDGHNAHVLCADPDLIGSCLRHGCYSFCSSLHICYTPPWFPPLRRFFPTFLSAAVRKPLLCDFPLYPRTRFECRAWDSVPPLLVRLLVSILVKRAPYSYVKGAAKRRNCVHRVVRDGVRFTTTIAGATRRLAAPIPISA